MFDWSAQDKYDFFFLYWMEQKARLTIFNNFQ